MFFVIVFFPTFFTLCLFFHISQKFQNLQHFSQSLPVETWIKLSYIDDLFLNPVDRKHANGKMRPGKSWSWIQRIPILDFLENLNSYLYYVVSRILQISKYIWGKRCKIAWTLNQEFCIFFKIGINVGLVFSIFWPLHISRGRGWWCEKSSTKGCQS